MIDLHTHSTASDGSLSPRELARAGKAAGLDVMALTDHDCAKGLGDFLDEAGKIGLVGIPGVELSAEVPRGQLHLIGLGFDPSDPALNAHFRALLQGRAARNQAILRAFRDNGVPLAWEEVCAFAGDELVSRVHFAQALVAKGLAADVKDAFARFLAKGAPCYRDRPRLAPADCIAAIRAAGGVTVMAHPLSLDPDPATLAPKVAALRDLGLQAMECHYSGYGAETVVALLRIALRLGLTPSVGSDFHGAPKPDIALGRLPVPRETEARLRALLRLPA